MNEESKNPEVQPLFTLQALDEYFHAHCNNSACPFCGGETWYLAEPSNGKVFSALATKIDGTLTLGAEALPMVTLICQECHFVRQHALKPISEWVADQANTVNLVKPVLKRTK